MNKIQRIIPCGDFIYQPICQPTCQPIYQPNFHNQHSCHMCNTNTGRLNSTIDAVSVTKYFITEYYRNVSNMGWNTIQHLFAGNCNVMLKDRTIGNEYDLLNLLTTEFIKKANYGNIRIKCAIIDGTNLLINTFGQIQFVSLSGQLSNSIAFTETFVLTLVDNANNTISCTHHIFDF